MNQHEKKNLLRRFPHVLSSNNIHEIDDFHRLGQQSIRLHFCAHICYARHHFSQRDLTATVVDVWRMTCSPLATISLRIGLDQRRRFFGLGPLR